MLDVIAQSTDPDYTTTSALRALILGATATSTGQDAQFAQLIRSASNWVDSTLSYPIAVASYRETAAGYGRRTLRLSRTPLRAVAAVYDATDTGTATQLQTSDYKIEDADAGLLARNQGFQWAGPFQSPGAGGSFPSSIPLDPAPLMGQESKPWLVDYVAGWTYGGVSTASPNWSTANGGTTSTGRTLPADIEQATLLKARLFYIGGREIEREQLGDLQVNYRSLSVDEPDDLLSPFVRYA